MTKLNTTNQMVREFERVLGKSYSVKNTRAKAASAARERNGLDAAAAHNYAKATSEFFHGVFEVASNGVTVCYYVGGRKFLREETALARAF